MYSVRNYVIKPMACFLDFFALFYKNNLFSIDTTLK